MGHQELYHRAIAKTPLSMICHVTTRHNADETQQAVTACVKQDNSPLMTGQDAVLWQSDLLIIP